MKRIKLNIFLLLIAGPLVSSAQCGIVPRDTALIDNIEGYYFFGKSDTITISAIQRVVADSSLPVVSVKKSRPCDLRILNYRMTVGPRKGDAYIVSFTEVRPPVSSRQIFSNLKKGDIVQCEVRMRINGRPVSDMRVFTVR
jgi:hypothetical protein